MSKEITIDGVDVAGCCCIENGFCLWVKKYYETGITPKCEQVQDCYYKQLKRLEQENARLKEENEELCDRMAAVTYRATGGRLSYSSYTLDAIEQAFYDQLDILSDQKIEPYKHTLQEIKEIATTCMCKNIDGCYDCQYFDDCEIEEADIPTRDVCKLIINKINEVQND